MKTIRKQQIRSSRRFAWIIALLVLGIAMAHSLRSADAQEVPKIPTAKGEAAPDQAIVGSKLGGSFFAPKPLKEKYNQLVSKARSLEIELNGGTISGQQAQQEIKQLRDELAATRAEIEKQKTFVPAAKIHTKSETTTYSLGSERRLLILASKVRILGWDKPEVQCVLEKVVLTADDQPADEDLGQIQVVHEHRSAEKEIGKTAEDIEAEEAAYLQSTDGKKLNQKQVEYRRKFLEERMGWQKIYRPLQGREIDVVSVKGLSHDEGNRQITLEVGSPNGERSMSSHWQRHAMLTVYVPACEAIGLQGGLGGLEVDSVDSAVIIRGDGDRDYEGQFVVKGIKGSLTADRIPLQTIDGVTGNVDISMTAYLGNSGTRHADDTRTSYVYPPQQYSYKDIGGSFHGHFVRADLQLENIAGTIDVVNEYGTTKFSVSKRLTAAAHRVVSNGGRIEVQLSEDALGDLPFLAVSECGTVRINNMDRKFEEVSWNGPLPGGELRGWRGFERKAPAAGPDSFLARFERIGKVLSGEDRTAGLDLVSRGGSIEVGRAK
jgi:hypothetical protein